MEKFFGTEYGLVGVCVVLTLHLLWRVALFVYEFKKKVDDTDKNETHELVVEVKKMRRDLRRFYSAIRILAGDEWPKIRQEIMQDDFAL